MRGRNVVADPTLAEPLEERGLLRVLEPETFVDEEIATELTEAIEALIRDGAFDGLSKAGGFAELSMSRMGLGVLDTVARRVLDELSARGRGRCPPQDEASRSRCIHASRSIYLVLLAQLARQAGGAQRAGLASSDQWAWRHRSVRATGPISLRCPHAASSSPWISRSSLSIVDSVPLDEVLEFKQENHREHRRYMENLRTFAAGAEACIEEVDRARALQGPPSRAARAGQRSTTQACSRSVEKPQGRPHGFGLGLAGAAMVGGGSQSPFPQPRHPGCWSENAPSGADGSVYSYLFRASRSLP